MIKRAIVLAAGRGIPIGDDGIPNCLADVGGRPMLRRTLEVLASAGVRHVALVVGFGAPAMRTFVAALPTAAPQLDLEITVFENPRWSEPNGLSVLAARPFVTERVLLVMADQIAAPALVGELTALPDTGDQTVLCVDGDLDRVFDIDDATKIELDGDKVAGISKQLTRYGAVSASLFVMSASLMEALGSLDAPSLTEGIAVAAARGLVTRHDVRGQLWQDVDSPAMRLHAEWLLRVYGDDLARPQVDVPPPAPAQETLALVERLLAEKDAPRYTLFNPGPVMTSAAVKSALVHYDMCHRDADYSGVVRRLQGKLRPLFGAGPDHEMLLLTASGTAAMEMAVASVVPPGRKLLVIENGAFGERLGEIADLHHIDRVTARAPWGQLPDLAAIEEALADPTVAACAAIHNETSIGILNPIGDIGRLCRARDVTFIVDAVSTLGAEDVDVVRDGIDVCYSSANKCLHSVSGASFLCVAPVVWERIADVPPRVYYLDMKRYRRYLTDLDQTPFTPTVSAFFALEAALDELAAEGGVPARRDAYRLRSMKIRRVLADLGFESLTNTGRESHAISTVRLPDFLTVDGFYDDLKSRGFIIYRCKGELGKRHVQVANMGALDDRIIDAFLTAVREIVEAARPARPEPIRGAARST